MADIKLTPAEQEKALILQKAMDGKITNDQAAKQLKLSIRQVQRAKAALRQTGIAGIVHGLKGKPGNHRISAEIKEDSLALIKEKYSDFKPSFATEKLAQNHNITLSYGTTRLWMIEEGLWKVKRHKQITYRAFRERLDYFGEMEQFDGSYHLWFEDRLKDELGNPVEVCLLASVDDATGQITKAVFALNEGVEAVFTFWEEYVKEVGKPLKVYLDKFSTYKVNHKSAVDNSELLTQFQAAMRLLNIELIPAHSPEAKGRIERLFQTLQDRLVKEMRLADVCTIEGGNQFLDKVFIPQFNAKFGVMSKKDGDVHRNLSKEERLALPHIFSVKSVRVVNNDFTIQFKNHFYQLQEIQPTTIRPQDKVTVEEHLDGTIHLEFHQKYLNYFILPEKPKKMAQPVILTTHPLNYRPPLDHPWRQLNKQLFAKLKG